VAYSLAAVMTHLAEAEHITIDGHFSPARTITRPNYSTGAGLGKQVGSDLSAASGSSGRLRSPGRAQTPAAESIPTTILLGSSAGELAVYDQGR